MMNIEFAKPNLLYLLLVLVPVIAWYVWQHRKLSATLQISTLDNFKNTSATWKVYLRHSLLVLRVLAIAMLIFILARPQTVNKWEDTVSEGIDIVLALDISGSMLARDFEPDRLEASKDVAVEFVSGRPDDRIGLVVFSGESYTQCPLTTDHPVLINSVTQIQQGIINDGTAMGLGLANAVNRLKSSTSKTKLIILLTDGVNNMGDIAPITAADIARNFGIRVYTIGVGRNGYAPYPVQTPWGVEYQNMEVKIDEVVLKQIADKTGGKYFRATDNQKLKAIYKEIDQMEKTKMQIQKHSTKKDEYFMFALLAAIFVVLEILLRNTVFRTIP